MKIERERYVVMRNGRTEIWCGLARNYRFCRVDDLANTAIKTYRSAAQAWSGCSSHSHDFEIVKCKEIIEIEEESYG